MDELRHRRILLLSRVNAATSFDTDNIANGFARAEERILFMEAGVKASRSLSWPTQPLPAHQIHSTMEEEVQQALGKLKETIKEKPNLNQKRYNYYFYSRPGPIQAGYVHITLIL
ncbi:PspA/IM30 family protein [Aneurinibacillus aneurinilyticus]|uniref:Uncharacterized protein n=1 Tax=Aneurinibacillus aneurinilyticus TaxID=1391 RepID=A0A848CSU1_ANEAE|nr:hypothetical protein [Aneurinibacillus aneurinilyticus]NME97047.1 hypothetical protein [Aneurinibacillus aneurinilyticus]